MTINEFIRKYRVVKTKDYNGTKFADLWEDGISVNVFNPYVICNDDFEFSCQASSSHYSDPRSLADEYTQVEIGFPSLNDKLIEKYREDYGWEDDCGLTNPVYPYVPVEVVDQLIEFHCGINEKGVLERIEERKRKRAA